MRPPRPRQRTGRPAGVCGPAARLQDLTDRLDSTLAVVESAETRGEALAAVRVARRLLESLLPELWAAVDRSERAG